MVQIPTRNHWLCLLVSHTSIVASFYLAGTINILMNNGRDHPRRRRRPREVMVGNVVKIDLSYYLAALILPIVHLIFILQTL